VSTNCELYDNCLTCPFPDCWVNAPEKANRFLRQKEVKKLIEQGYRKQEIANKLSLSFSTLGKYMRGTYEHIK